MSADPGKVQLLGVTEIGGEKVIALRMLQGRNPDWAMRLFFAQYDEEAVWLSDLRPAFGEKRFFFESELESMYRRDGAPQPRLAGNGGNGARDEDEPLPVVLI
jgi:hypothetical protein